MDSLSERQQARVVKLYGNVVALAGRVFQSNFVFPRKKRLLRSLFPAALATGRRISSTHFTAVIPKNTEALPAGRQGYAVVVSKKVAKLSVTRHMIKRKIVSALRTLKLPPALIVFSRSSLDGVHYKDIEKELAGLLSNIKN
jgi:ribonuclease P protein component